MIFLGNLWSSTRNQDGIWTLLGRYLFSGLFYFSDFVGNFSKFSPKCTWLRYGHNSSSFQNCRETKSTCSWKGFKKICFWNNSGIVSFIFFIFAWNDWLKCSVLKSCCCFSTGTSNYLLLEINIVFPHFFNQNNNFVSIFFEYLNNSNIQICWIIC